MSGQGNESKSKKGVVIALIIVLCIIVLLLLVIILLMLRKPAETAETEDNGPRSVLVTEDNLGDVLGEHESKANDDRRAYRYTVTMTDTEWTFENGQSSSPDSWVKNDSNNDTDVYFDITRNDTGEVIYKSPIIPLGQSLEEVKLDTELPAGTYDCTMEYSLVDDDHETVLSTVDIALTIIILN